jgi:hypothetical protein
MFEDTKGVIRRSHAKKNRKYNDQKKKDKKINDQQKQHRKLYPTKNLVNSGAPEG